VFALAVVAGLFFAGFFLSIDQAHSAGGAQWWPVVGARLSGSIVVVAVVVLGRSRPIVTSAAAPLLVLTAVGDLGGTLLFSFAVASGPLSVATVLSSLYPVGTVLLAWLVLHERLAPTQLVGVVLALAGVVLISA
jgi:drug/metabolite transporter (DMT)-like permease